MSYIVVFRKNGGLVSLLFRYRDEADVAFSEGTLIRNEDDVIKAMMQYFHPDNGDMIIRETLLDAAAYREEEKTIAEQLRKLLDEEDNIP